MYLIRHAETAWNTEGIGFGHTDIPLGDAGVEAARIMTLPPEVRRVFTSPLARAYETAAILCAGYSLPIITPALIERHHGAGEGIYKSLLQHPVAGRETDDQIRARALPFLSHLSHDCLVVTHAGVIQAVTGRKAAHLEVIEWHPGM